jgi:subtilisin family serine protease
MIKPEAAWAMGATGQGIKVAIIDDGVISGTHDLTGQISSDSTDVVGTRNQPFQSRDQHGTMVAGFLAASSMIAAPSASPSTRP